MYNHDFFYNYRCVKPCAERFYVRLVADGFEAQRAFDTADDAEAYIAYATTKGGWNEVKIVPYEEAKSF